MESPKKPQDPVKQQRAPDRVRNGANWFRDNPYLPYATLGAAGLVLTTMVVLVIGHEATDDYCYRLNRALVGSYAINAAQVHEVTADPSTLRNVASPLFDLYKNSSPFAGYKLIQAEAQTSRSDLSTAEYQRLVTEATEVANEMANQLGANAGREEFIAGAATVGPVGTDHATGDEIIRVSQISCV
jgi:hypothetical protein